MGGHARLRVGLRVLLAGLAFLLLSAGNPVAGEKENAWCEPRAEIRPQLDAIDPWGRECWAGQPCWRWALEAATKLRAMHPDDLFVNRTYQDLVRLGGRDDPNATSALVRDYSERARRHPRDPVAQYLAARVSEDTGEARKLYEAALAIVPGFPWAHLGVAVAEAKKRDPASRDRASMRRHVEAFMTLCPTQLVAVLQPAPALEALMEGWDADHPKDPETAGERPTREDILKELPGA
jgi:hypothetical protein